MTGAMREMLHRIFVATNLHASGGTITRTCRNPDDLIVILSPGCEDHNGSGQRGCDNCGRWY